MILISSEVLIVIVHFHKSQEDNFKNSQRNLYDVFLVSLGAELSIGRAYPKTGGLRGDEFRPPGKVRLSTKLLCLEFHQIRRSSGLV